MANRTYFVQECPTCGRRLQIRVEYLGKSVVCQHCRGRLIAADPAGHRYPDAEPQAQDILRRADELLRTVDEGLAQSRLTEPRY
jgi:DNA-directed RNA polymerase subunit RPC12/RpoP